MIKSVENFRNVVKNKDFKKVSTNFFYLFIPNVTNFVLPLVTFPYLVSRLGVEKFGLLAFVTSIISYFLIFTDYGFNLTATRQISIHRGNKEKINEIVSSVFIIKFLLIVLSLVLLFIVVSVVPKFQEHSLIYFCAFG